MIGSFLTRGLVMILGYAYPAYECFKTVERNKPEIEQLRFWCQYWILVAVMTVFERVGDTFVSWVPMYSEAKLAFIIYLWYPKTKGTTFVYDSFFQPYVSKHETEIDRNLLELRSRAGDMAFMYCQGAVSFGQTRIFEILQYVAAQSTPRTRPKQAENQAPEAPQKPATVAVSPTAPPRQPTTRIQPPPPPPPPQAPQPEPQPRPQPQPQAQVEAPPSSTSSTSSSPLEDDTEDQQSTIQGSSTSAPTLSPLPPPSPLKKSISMPVAPPSPKRPTTIKAERMQLSKVPSKIEKPSAKSPTRPQETVMEESIRVTRGRLRKTRSAGTK